MHTDIQVGCSRSKRNQHLLSPQQREIPKEMKLEYHEADDSGECKNFKVPEELKFQGDRLLEDIERMKSRLSEGWNSVRINPESNQESRR